MKTGPLFLYRLGSLRVAIGWNSVDHDGLKSGKCSVRDIGATSETDGRGIGARSLSFGGSLVEFDQNLTSSLVSHEGPFIKVLGVFTSSRNTPSYR